MKSKTRVSGDVEGSQPPRGKSRLMTMVFAILAVTAIETYARAPSDPAPVRLTEKALTTEQAQAAQKAWADHIGIEAAYENSIGMQLRVIPSGTYRILSRRAKDGDKGPVEATLSQAYLIGQFEVSQGEWKRVMGPIKQQLDAGAGDRFPIYRINHAEATEFCRKLTQLERKAGKLPDGYEYRLPTASEREFACRAGTLTRYHFGDKMSSRLANYDGTRPVNGTEKGPNLDKTTEVGTYPANAWGLHDMHGNLAEWCMDWFYDKEVGGVDPVQLKPSANWETEMVIRGSGWGYPGEWTHSANRYHAPADVRRPTIGFRPVLSKLQPDRAVEPGKENVPRAIQQFEYLVRYVESGRKQQEVLNELGRDGWELVAVHPLGDGAKAHPFYFKRPLRSVRAETN